MTTAPRAARQRRICMLVYGDTPTGLPPMVNLAVSLVAAGFDVELICLAPQTPPAHAEVLVPGIRIRRLHVHTRRFFHAIFGKGTTLPGLAAVQYVASYIEFVTKAVFAALRSGADMYEANDLPPLLAAVVSARLRGKPVVFRAHELWSEATPNVRFAAFWRFMERCLVPRCDYVVTPDDNRSRIYELELKTRRPPITVRNCPLYRPPIASRRLRDELCRRGIRCSTVVLYQGLVDSGRCIEEIAEATRYFDDGVVLVIMGTGHGKWASPATSLSGYDRIVVLPPVPYHEVVPFTASADIGILLYRNDCRNNYYCAPNKLYEYMMMGLPMIAANYPGLLPLVEGEDVGLCVDPESPKAIADAVNRLAGDPDRRERMSRNGLQLTRDRYNWEIESTPLLELYGSLASSDVQ
jgi:glycosyltransferase involved in cell wall biosynthesis